MKFNFDLKTILFVLLILLFSVIFLYNFMPSHVEGFKEGADGDEDGDEDEVYTDEDGNPLLCDVDPSGNGMGKNKGKATYTMFEGEDNEVKYKCDASNNVIIA